MNRIFLVILMMLSTAGSLAQNDENFKRVTIAIESGFWYRGLVGLSSSINYLNKPKLFLSSDISVGVGFSVHGDNAFACISETINFKVNKSYFILGLESKYYKYAAGINESFLFKGSYAKYQSITLSPVVGVGFIRNSGFTFEWRFAVFSVIQNGSIQLYRPSLGFAFGYSF